MSASGVFPDYSNPGTAADENTVLTDYWLEFVAVREEVEEPVASPDRIKAEELYGRIESYGQRIEVLLEDQRKLRKQFETVIYTEQSGGRERFNRGSSAGLSSPFERSTNKTEVSGKRRNSSLADRFRHSFLYSAIQKLG